MIIDTYKTAFGSYKYGEGLGTRCARWRCVCPFFCFFYFRIVNKLSATQER